MRVAVSFSGGKDSAWALWKIRQNAQYDAVILFTTLTKDHVPLQNIPGRVVRAQAAAFGLSLHELDLPEACSNTAYREQVGSALEDLRDTHGIEGVVFGDLFLEDIRQFRESVFATAGVKCLFPLWGTSSAELAREMISGGLQAVISAVDTAAMESQWLGRRFDERLLAELPTTVDPCGENGEFHTLCFDGPMFATPVDWSSSGVRTESRFAYLLY